MTDRPPGRVFTPAPLADAMWRLVGRFAQGPVRRVVEPGAGDGALLRAGFAWASAAGASLDIDAIELDAPSCAALRALTVPAPHALRVVHADALALVDASAPPTEAARRFGAPGPHAFAGDRLLGEGIADVVVANPPYLRETGNADVFRALRSWHQGYDAPWYRKDTDLHVFFWRRAMQWLRPGGLLVIVTPAYVFEAASARPLRSALAEQGDVLAVWRAGDHASFASIGVEAGITVWRRATDHGSPRAREAIRLDAAMAPTPARVRIPASGAPWWLDDADPVAVDALAQDAASLGALYQIVEGVSTGANRLTARTAPLVEGGRVGAGVMLLDDAELDRLGVRGDPRVARRWSVSGRHEHVVRVRDGSLPHLDAGDPPRTALEHHLCRMRPVLEARAEMRRNAARSWYATAWPRAELDRAGCIVTPKWARAPAFVSLEAGAVPMTDCRVLVPRSAEIAAARDAVLAWLGGDIVRAWLLARLKRKGPLLEFYGEPLAAVPVPHNVWRAA